MSIQPKRWDVCLRAPESHFEKFPDLSPLVVQILYNRKFRTEADVRDFLAYRWPDDDPFELQDMTRAVERLSWAIERQEPIAVYGDYDADGVTASALMMNVLTRLGARAEVYIPNRFDEGYGLNTEALVALAGKGIKLVLTVDCGIRSIHEVAFGNSLGLDIIITDHHNVGTDLPPARAAINPKRSDCVYPFKDLAGVGLAYKLVQALQSDERLSKRLGQAQLQADQFLDLVALGTVADLAPLYGENRKLVAHGLHQLNRSLRPGLAALVKAAELKSPTISSGTIGFVIGPRLNAAGRLDSALAAYRLLMAPNELEAIHLATQLDLQNRERQRLTHQMVELARQVILEDEGQSPLYLISNPDFNPGVVGLAASRLTEEFYRPVLVAEQGPEQTKGSARSIGEFHITQALDKCADLLVRYGGHAAAAGFTVQNENLPALRDRLLQIASDQLNVSQLQPTLEIDGEVNLRAVGPSLVEEIIRLQPFGYGNRTPCFLTRDLQVKYRKAVGQDGRHLRLVLNDGRRDWSAIGFRQGEWANRLNISQPVDVVYGLEFNEWNGQRRLQLNVKDLQPGQS